MRLKKDPTLQTLVAAITNVQTKGIHACEFGLVLKYQAHVHISLLF